MKSKNKFVSVDIPVRVNSFSRMLLICFFIPFLLACLGEDKPHGIVEMFHDRPKSPRIVPRMMIGGKDPSGVFGSQTVQGIVVLDTGADFDISDSLTYLTYLDERYEDSKGLGDLPFHYFVDQGGIIFKGRNDSSPAELYKNDPFVYRSDEIDKKDLLIARLECKKPTATPISLTGYIAICMLGDYDKQLVIPEQEKSLYQLIAFLCFQNNIQINRIVGLNDLYPETNNPGFYLKNYVRQDILLKNIPTPPRQSHFLRTDFRP